MAAANRGEAGAFEALYHRHRDFVHRVALRFSASREDALDVLQDAFLHLLSRFPGFELTARLTTYLYPVVRHLARDRRLRRRPANAPLEALPEGAAWDPPSPEAAREELAAVLAVLPEAQRETLLLRFAEDLELADIAAAMAVPVGTVKSRLHHALAHLRGDPRTRDYFA